MCVLLCPVSHYGHLIKGRGGLHWAHNIHQLDFIKHFQAPTIVGILTFMSGTNSILGLSELNEKPKFLEYFILMSI